MYARLEKRKREGAHGERGAEVDNEITTGTIDGYRHRYLPPPPHTLGKSISKVAVKPFIIEFKS